jgi:cytochrome c oxidase subunit 2
MIRRASILPLALPLSACSGVQAMSEGAGFGSLQFNHLMALFLAITGLSYVLVLGFLAFAMKRRVREPDPRRVKALLIGWTGFIVLGLIVLTAFSFLNDRQEAAMAADVPPLTIKVTASQWWWGVEYSSSDPQHTLTTANELHLPVGRPADVELNASDVIHSFWIPALGGKKDLIPGRSNTIRLLPTRVGRYRAQCAEFCGMEHAHMAFDVVVESPRAFAAWYDAQLKPAPQPQTALAKAGHDWFMSHACANCHAIAGTDANGHTGPDLTHVAGRPSIAAGTLPMTRGNLMGWIANPQGVKPGARMPTVSMTANELRAVGAYLETLK